MVGVVAGLYFIVDQGIKLNLVFWALDVFLPETSLLYVTPETPLIPPMLCITPSAILALLLNAQYLVAISSNPRLSNFPP